MVTAGRDPTLNELLPEILQLCNIKLVQDILTHVMANTRYNTHKAAASLGSPKEYLSMAHHNPGGQ